MTIDLHLDLAMNAMEWNRDLRLPVSVINEREKGWSDKPDRGNATVSFPALKEAGIRLVVATQLARVVKPGSTIPGWFSAEQAWAQTQAQLAWYRAMEACDEMKQVSDLPALEEFLKQIDSPGNDKKPLGYILSLEGADSLVDISYVEKAYEYGLRAIGPAHYGPGRYANGTNSSGKMGADGLALLREMERLNIILDATHLCDDAFWQALDHFGGHVWASHSNCRAIVDHNRQFSDEQIRELINRGAIIGAAMDAWMIVPGWVKNQSTPGNMQCNLEKLTDHIDHICFLAGNSRHVCIGTDLDGGYGREQCPSDIETIADIRRWPEILKKRGYTEEDIHNIFHDNALRFLRNAWS
jgi:membrane dipeptidase